MTDAEVEHDRAIAEHADAVDDRRPMAKGWVWTRPALPYQQSWRHRRHQLTVIWSIGWPDHEMHRPGALALDPVLRDFWLHVSCSRVNMTPTHEHMAEVKALFVGPERWAYSVWAPEDQHINLHATALHLWAPWDNRPRLPDFGRYGTI